MRKYVDKLRGWQDELEREDMRKHFQPGVDQIIVANGRDIGRLSVVQRSDRMELRHIEIDPEYQRRGIGTVVIQDVLSAARKAGLPTTLIVLDINPAKRLYERLGFKIIETVDCGEKGMKCVMKAAVWTVRSPSYFEAQAETARPPESLWKHSDFLKLWSAQTISATGDQFTSLAIPLIATLMLGATATQMGVLTALGTAPFLLISLFAGVWVDRLPRRPILIIGDLGRALVLLSIPVATLVHSLRMRQLFAVELLVGILSVFFDISYQAYLPALVDRRSLVEGNSKLETTRSLASLIGPSLAGVAIQAVSAPAVIVLDAVSFICSGGLISMIGRHETHQSQTGRSPMLAEVRQGLVVVFGNPLLRSIAGCTGTLNFFSTTVYALYILFATRGLGLGPVQIGFIFGLGNVAALLGAMGGGWLGIRLGVGRTIIAAAFLLGIGLLPIAIATSSTAFGLLVLSRLFVSFGNPVYNINQVSLRQAITPQHLQGRMNATMRFLVWGTMPIRWAGRWPTGTETWIATRNCNRSHR